MASPSIKDDIKEQFRGKRITLMGLGLLGRGIGDANFFASAGAQLIITDLKTEAELASSIAELAAFPEITYHLGAHHLEDFENRDLIIRAPNAPLDSLFLAHARGAGIPIEMDSALFVKLCREKFPPSGEAATNTVTIVGITGTRGKSTTTHLIYEMARAAGKKVHLGGNERDVATLPLIEEVELGDIVILELDSWQLQGFEEDKISPNISVWTNFMPDHMNYYKGDMDRYFRDKAAIARFQHAGDAFIAPQDIKERIEKSFGAAAGMWTAPADLSGAAGEASAWEIALPGEHNRANAACAVAAARALGISDEIIKTILKTFTALPNRLEFLGEKYKVEFYNDSNATTPDATIAAIKTLAAKNKPITLIAGGSDKDLDFAELAAVIADKKSSVKYLVLFNGAATEKLRERLTVLLSKNFPITMAASMEEAFKAALPFAITEPPTPAIILLSPGATSFGIFKNEYDRGEQFKKAFENLD